MRAVTIKEAKAHLNELVDLAVAGEQVVLMRGPKRVAAIVPVSPVPVEELELAPRLADDQAARFWQNLARRRMEVFDSPEKAVAKMKSGKLGKSSRRQGP